MWGMNSLLLFFVLSLCGTVEWHDASTTGMVAWAFQMNPPMALTTRHTRECRPESRQETCHPNHPDCLTLYGIKDFFQARFGGRQDTNKEEKGEDKTDETQQGIPFTKQSSGPFFSSQQSSSERASICIIGGGVAGLMAAITAAEGMPQRQGSGSSNVTSICVLEASPTFGGRVQSDTTSDGFILDRGFAVFIEEYPKSKNCLDYEALGLAKFLPGAMVQLPNNGGFAKVADPLRQPQELWTALTAPVGTLMDKIKVLPLIYHMVTSDVSDLFLEEETTTLAALKQRWGFSDEMINTFYKPFLEGIYLAPLEQQSSRMFSFVFKMFSQGAATLPRGGMGTVTEQLLTRATAAGVTLTNNCPVRSVSIQQVGNDENGRFVVESVDGTRRILADTVIVATDVRVAESLISQVGVEVTEPQPQQSVGCLYYGFDGEAPIQEPILILSGLGDERGTEKFPINNLCFPSVVNPSYAPPGKALCSVTVLNSTMKLYKGREDDLDLAVRRQLKTWFPEYNTRAWKLKGMYSIPNAQPAQWGGCSAASVNGGRDCRTFRGTPLPPGLLVCGDHMATATLNGALESGLNAGNAVLEACNTHANA